MRKAIYPIFIIVANMYFGQNTAFQNNQNMNNGILRNGLNDGAKNAYNIEGSPFIDINFIKAKIVGIDSAIFMRYNAMKDEVEVKEGDIIQILPKEELYSKIILESGDRLNLVNYEEKNKKVKGYLFLIAEKNEIKLYRKKSIILTKEKEAKNSYEESRPAEYKKQKDVYFIELNNKIIQFPTNKKKLISLLPEKKNIIETTDINFSKDSDLVKIFNLL